MSDLTTICCLPLPICFPLSLLNIFICLALIFGASTFASRFSIFVFKHVATLTTLCKNYRKEILEQNVFILHHLNSTR